MIHMYFAGCALPTVMTKAREDISQQYCQHLGQVMPATILTAAEMAAEAKEQAIRRRHQLPDEAQNFADGFAIGLAFLLQVGGPIALIALLDQQNTIATFDMPAITRMNISCMYTMCIRLLQAISCTCGNSMRP